MSDTKTASQPEIGMHPDRDFSIAAENLSEAQRAFLHRIESGPRGKVPFNQRIWMHNMDFADVAEKFGAYVSARAPMAPRCKEICILVVAGYWDSAFEWFWHEKMAHKLGITPAQTDLILNKQVPRFEDPAEQATHDIAFALNQRRDIPDELYARAESVLGRNAVLDLIGLMALYTMIAHTIMLFRVPVPKG